MKDNLVSIVALLTIFNQVEKDSLKKLAISTDCLLLRDSLTLAKTIPAQDNRGSMPFLSVFCYTLSMTYKIFMSHSPKDKTFVKVFSDIITSHLVNISTFISSDCSIKYGDEFLKTIENELNSSNLVLVFISNNSIDSHWIYAEAYAGICQNKKVIPILLDNIQVEDITFLPLSSRQVFNLYTSSRIDYSEFIRQLCEYVGIEMNNDCSNKLINSFMLDCEKWIKSAWDCIDIVKIYYETSEKIPNDYFGNDLVINNSSNNSSNNVLKITLDYEQYITIFKSKILHKLNDIGEFLHMDFELKDGYSILIDENKRRARLDKSNYALEITNRIIILEMIDNIRIFKDINIEINKLVLYLCSNNLIIRNQKGWGGRIQCI